MKPAFCTGSCGSFVARKKVGTQNESYFGWSWTIGTASWVEPTSYAIISMRATPPEWMSAAAKRRLRIGEAMLFDRMCPGGGWNCGNPMVYGVPGEPQVSSSVWALLALREHPERPEVQKSLEWLQGKLEFDSQPGIPGPRANGHERIRAAPPAAGRVIANKI